MEIPKKGFSGFKQNFVSNLLAAFSVSLVALPLALGLAIASGVPAVSGIIAAVVGGVLCSFLGNSKVIITGPGNGLVVVIASSVAVLGAGDPVLGYKITLAAIIFSGVLMSLFGFLKLGNLGDFFPAAAIQGMLAAIGLLIISKQINVLIGIKVFAYKPYQLLLALPESIKKVIEFESIPYVAIIGVGSLLFLIGYSKLKNKYIKMIPAPMWVVLISVIFSYYFEIFKGGNPIADNFLISLPDKIGDSIQHPVFEKIFTSDFALAIIGITLVATIESLLSIKAVEKLDKQQRRVNLNTDLKALGLSSIVSGFLGGLPVVAVIARSSVNINHGAKTAVSNFLHASFLVVFIVLGKGLIERIPFSALAAILVYTGYKLAAPRVFKKVYKTGKEQLFIFVITFISTFLFGLVKGISIGIITTFLIQFLMTSPKELIPRHLFRPNTLMYQEDNDTYYVGVKWFSNFLNFLSLKSLLDSIPNKRHVILDFSLTRLVDNSVMEHIYHYSDDYVKKGGYFEVVGLDAHNPSSIHPYAGRRILKNKKQSIETTLTDREAGLQKYAEKVGWTFKPYSAFDLPNLFEFSFFSNKDVEYAYNLSVGEIEDLTYKLFDIEYTTGALVTKEVYRSTMLLLNFNNKKIPRFIIDRDSRTNDGVFDSGSINEILYKESEESVEDPEFFNPVLKVFLDSNPYYSIESIGQCILIAKKGRVASISEVKALVEFGEHINDILKQEIC